MDFYLFLSEHSEIEKDDQLILVERSSGTDDCQRRCQLCLTDVSAPYYTSKEDGESVKAYLHKACADLPKEMEHKLHSGHTLRLQKGVSHQTCSVCDGRGDCLIYSCCDCNEFSVDIRCVLKLFPVTHPCHEHPLIPIHEEDESFNCVSCKRNSFGISYKCTTCSFRVHQSCASSRIVTLPSHRHNLELIYSIPGYECCESCGEYMPGESYAYHCSRCRYYVHSYNCRPIHFSHDHPLVLVQEEANVHDASENCYGCGMRISPPYYVCGDMYYAFCNEFHVSVDQCRHFFLHKACAELPQSMEHHLHPEHTLTLVTETSQVCGICQAQWDGFSYSCLDDYCGNFTLDLLCATKTLQLKHEFHQHPLISSPSKAPLACHACNRDSEGSIYQCTTCRFWVHQQCASVPTFKRIDFHPHCLTLAYSSSGLSCQVCRQEIQTHNWAYVCDHCRYLTHIHNCFDLSREFDSEVLLPASVNLPSADEFVTLAVMFFMDINREEDNRFEPEPHSIVGNGTGPNPFLDKKETCQNAAPCNNCALCNYFLLKSPAKLHNRFSFEEYCAVLKDAEGNCGGFAITWSRDFSSLKMNVNSSFLPRYIKHEGHRHVLSTSYITERTWCNGCGNDFEGYGFKCKICNFTIDTYCALLPGSVRHSYDKKHPFKLAYYSVEGVEEYVCEICEGDITTPWFYHCEECDQSIHPRCIWDHHTEFGPFIIGADHPETTTSFHGEEKHPECRYSSFSETSARDIDHLQQITSDFTDQLERWPIKQEATNWKKLKSTDPADASSTDEEGSDTGAAPSKVMAPSEAPPTPAIAIGAARATSKDLPVNTNEFITLIIVELDKVRHACGRLGDFGKQISRRIRLLDWKLEDLKKSRDPPKYTEAKLRNIEKELIDLKIQLRSAYKRQSDERKESWSSIGRRNAMHLDEAEGDYDREYFQSLFKDYTIEGTLEFKDFMSLYNTLGSDKKVCLLSFSVFPENEIIRKRFMVYWWLAEGFIRPTSPEDQRTPEELAREVFEELMEKQFIQPFWDQPSFEVKWYTMHPFIRSALVNVAKRANFFNFDSTERDIAVAAAADARTATANVAVKAKLVKDTAAAIPAHYATSHQAFLLANSEFEDKPGIRKIHILFNVDETEIGFEMSDMLVKMESLNILCLGRWQHSPTHHIQLEDNTQLKRLRNMKFLKFLSLQGIIGIKELPSSMFNLPSLIILDLRACLNLEKIPSKIGLLKSLTHLDMSGCFLLDCMPNEISSLSQLQVLKGFVIGNSSSAGKVVKHCTVEHLAKLKNLRKLSIFTRRKDFPTKAELEHFNKFSCLLKLTIVWRSIPTIKAAKNSPLPTRNDTEQQPGQVSGVKNANLPVNLEKLDLQKFPGQYAPGWLQARNLGNLKKLYIRGGILRDLGQNFIGEERKRWGEVEILRVKYLKTLEMDWRELQDLFPKLVYLEKVGCPKLTLFPCDRRGIWKKDPEIIN